jgi:hypothetical protein
MKVFDKSLSFSENQYLSSLVTFGQATTNSDMKKYQFIRFVQLTSQSSSISGNRYYSLDVRESESRLWKDHPYGKLTTLSTRLEP